MGLAKHQYKTIYDGAVTLRRQTRYATTTDIMVSENFGNIFFVKNVINLRQPIFLPPIAEFSGYFKARKIFLKELDNAKATSTTMKFYDSNTGNLLFEAPVGRSHDEFLAESVAHGWPSFRDEEVNWDQVRCLRGGEAISLAGTHLGHNLPDKKGNRYCINLVSCAGNPVQEECSAAPTPAE